jgi:hypothetical protein
MSQLSGKEHFVSTSSTGSHTDLYSPVARPSKMQKLQINTQHNATFFYESSPQDGSGPSGYAQQQQHQEDYSPAQEAEDQHTDYNQETEHNQETEYRDPFFYYEESHVEESVQNCNLSLIGKILSDKPIFTQILHSSLTGIWCNPMGFKISELAGKKYQLRMEREEDLQRALKGSPWIIRNCWLILHQWERGKDIQNLDFTHVPLWMQFWGLPLHCQSLNMGKEMGGQIGTVLDVGIYDFPGSAKTVKVKINFNVQHPIRPGMYIGNNRDGISWIDFRYENLPMFCFGCGLVGHNIENCRNPHTPYEGGTNPRGTWLRTKIFGKRIIERPEKTFRSNALNSISGGQFSPIPKGLLNKMASMQINKQGGNLHRQGNNTTSPSNSTTPRNTHVYQSNQLIQTPTAATTSTYQITHHNLETESRTMKRKLENTPSGHQDKETQGEQLAGLVSKASQKP